MRRLRAVMRKDLTLFLRGAGGLALLLPFVLLLFFAKEKETLLSDVTLKPFPIAIRDEDETYMSRTLIRMVGDVELFSRVYVVEEETDAELFAEGYAAVTTIPKDFFYEMYVSDKRPALLSLNEEMPLQATLYRAVFTSVMDVIRVEEAAHYGMYFYVYGKLNRQQKIDAYNETSENLFLDILGRQQVFDSDIMHSDTPSSDFRRLVAILLTVVAVLSLTGLLSSVPEERKKRILPRFIALGGRPFCFALSRYLLLLFFLTPILIAVCLLVSQAERGSLFFCILLLSSATFLAFFALSLHGSGARMMRRTGSFYLLFSLILSGTIWPLRGLPPFVSYWQRLTLPYQFRMVLENASLLERGKEMLPFLLVHLFLFLLGSLARGSKKPAGTGAERENGSSALPNRTESEEKKQTGTEWNRAEKTEKPQMEVGEVRLNDLAKTRRRCCLLTLSKLRLIMGRRRTAGCMILVLLLCGVFTTFLQKGEEREIRILVWDEDHTKTSEELVDGIAKRRGVQVLLRSREEDAQERQRELLTGNAEGLLIVPQGYGRAVAREEDVKLHFESKASSFSNQGIREIIAGQNNILKAKARALREAEKRLGHPLSEEESRSLEQKIQRAENTFPSLYKVKTEKESVAKGDWNDPFAPDTFHFAIFGVMILLLAEAEVFASGDHRKVRRRLRALPLGDFCMCFSDLAAMVLTGAGILLCFLLPEQLLPGQFLAHLMAHGWQGGIFSLIFWRNLLQQLVPVLLFLIVLASLSLRIAYSSRSAGRNGAIAPYMALLFGLCGGCFTDVSAWSGLIGRLYPFLPTGALFMSLSGQKGGGGTALPVLVLQSLFFAGILRGSCLDDKTGQVKWEHSKKSGKRQRIQQEIW